MASSVTEMLVTNKTVLTIAKELKVGRSSVYQSLNGAGSRKIRVHIAVEVGKKPSELWTENDKEALALDDALYLMKVNHYDR